MPLEGKAKAEYQRDYMRRYRAEHPKHAKQSKRRDTAPEPELPEPTSPVQISIEELRASIGDNPIFYEMSNYKDALSLILTGTIEPLLFCGGVPGCGKTYELIKACEAAGLTPEVDYAFCAPGTDPHSLVSEIYAHRDFRLICLDDHDKLLRAKVAQEVIKSGWDVTKGRMIHWGTKLARSGFADHPPVFKVSCLLVWLSNYDNSKGTDDIDLEAIFDRGQTINVRGNQMDMFHYVMHRALFEDFAAEYPLEVRLEAALWFNANRNRVKKLSLRGMASALNRIHKAGDAVAKEKALKLLLHRKPVRDLPTFTDEEIAKAIYKQPRLTAAE